MARPRSRRRSSSRQRSTSWAGPDSYNHYAVGWAHAMYAPYQWTKQVASHWGGTRNGTIVHWPKGHQEQGRDALAVPPCDRCRADGARGSRLPQPTSVNGVQQNPIEGVSMLYSFNEAKAADRHETQYFEMFGNRGIYHKGWTAVTRHKTPWLLMARRCRPLTTTSGSSTTPARTGRQAKDLAKQMPEKLHELQRLWLIEATRYNVLPLDDDRRRTDESGSRRPSGPDQGEHSDPLRGHGASVRELGHQYQEQVALHHCRDRRARPRARRVSSSRKEETSAAGRCMPRAAS